MRHENCGGELKKYGKRPGRYRCVVCKVILKLGYAGPAGGGYIQKQSYTGRKIKPA